MGDRRGDKGRSGQTGVEQEGPPEAELPARHGGAEVPLGGPGAARSHSTGLLPLRLPLRLGDAERGATGLCVGASTPSTALGRAASVPTGSGSRGEGL